MDITITEVKQLLEELGWTNSEDDNDFINYLINEVTNKLTLPLGHSTVPDTLAQRAIGKVVGEFLFFKYASGNLGAMAIEASPKRVTEGDITIELGLDKTPLQAQLDMIASLRNIPESEMSAVRRIRWIQ